MRKLSWNAVLKRNCDGRISASLKIKYKKTICKVVVPDIDAVGAEDAFEEQFNNTLKTAFGKKKGKKIAEQVIDELSEL
jgi:hypothetical protein